MPQGNLQHGPFTDYLTEPVYPQERPRPSGNQSGGATALMIVDQFLRGASRGRKANFERAELDRARYENSLRFMADQIQGRTDLTRDAKQGALNQITAALFTEGRADMAQAKNPLSKIFDMVVGPGPKKVDNAARFDTVQSVLGVLQDPGSRLDRMGLTNSYLDQIKNSIAEAKSAKAGQPVYAEDVMAMPGLRDARTKLTYEGGFNLKDIDDQAEQLLLASGIPHRKEPGTIPAHIQNRLLGSGQPQPTSQPQVVSTTPQFTPTANPPSAPGAPSAPTASRLKLTDEDLMIGKLGEQQNYRDPVSGKDFMGALYNDPLGKNTGIINLSTREVVPDARQVPVSAGLTKYTPEQIETSRSSMHAAIKAMGSADADKYLASVDQHYKIGDIDGANRVFDSFIRAEEAKGNREAARSAAAGQRAFQNESGLMAQMNNDLEFKGFLAARDSMDQINTSYTTAKTDPTGASDLTFLRSMAKMTDRLTGVREGEYNTFEEAIGTLTKWGVKISQGWFSGQKLTPAGRDAFYKIAQGIYSQAEQGYRQRLGQYQDLGTRHGVSVPTNFIRPSQPTAAPPVPGGSGPAPGGSGRPNPHRTPAKVPTSF